MLSLEGINVVTGAIIGVASVVAIIAGWLRWIRPRLRRTREDGIAIRDAILGRDPIVDSITKKEIAPALPGIGQRMATVEQALITFAQNRHDLEEIGKLAQDNARRISKLEEAAVERVVTRAESTAAWRAMEAATMAQPDDEADEV